MQSADGEFDAAEIDKELISARLKKDVMEHTGKVHLFIADKVCLTFLLLLFRNLTGTSLISFNRQVNYGHGDIDSL